MNKPKHCVYCGDWYQCRDHIIPVSYAQTYRNYREKDTAPCCNLCNNLAGDSAHFTIQSKARYLHERYNKKFKKVLRLPVWTPSELKELDYGLRAYVVQRQHLKALIKLKIGNLELVMHGLDPVVLNKFKSHEEALKAAQSL